MNNISPKLYVNNFFNLDHDLNIKQIKPAYL